MMNEELCRLIKLVDKQGQLINTLNISLYSGLSGLALYNLELAELTKDDNYTRRAMTMYENIFENLNSSNFNASNISSFAGGLSGILYSINTAVNKGYLSSELVSENEDVEDFLFKECIRLIRKHVTDPLHGALGIVYFLSRLNRTPQREQYLLQILDEYLKILKIDDQGGRVRNLLLVDQEKEEFNLSLSHGMSGHLSIFYNLLNRGYENLLGNIILPELKYIKSHRLELDGCRTSYYPGVVIESIDRYSFRNQSSYDIRLGWCYGDLNQSLIFIKYGKALNDPHLLQEGIDLAVSTLSKKSLKETKIKNNDPFFCHGTIGLAYLYFKLYQNSGILDFKEGYEHWIRKTYEQLNNRGNEYTDKEYLSLLEGLPGVTLMLLSMEKNKTVSFDDIFFI